MTRVVVLMSIFTTAIALTDPPDRFLDVAREELLLEMGEVQLRQVIHPAKS